jgi:hypothetical protein
MGEAGSVDWAVYRATSSDVLMRFCKYVSPLSRLFNTFSLNELKL